MIFLGLPYMIHSDVDIPPFTFPPGPGGGASGDGPSELVGTAGMFPRELVTHMSKTMGDTMGYPNSWMVFLMENPT